mgnify:CR=1 FL=1
MPSLGIKRTKYGPGDKKKAYLVDSFTAFYIVVGVLASAALLFLIVAQTKESLWDAQHELMNDKTEAEKFSHKAAVQILQMTAELEAHLAEEIEWDTEEREYFERVQDLEEKLRTDIGVIVGRLKSEIIKALDSLPASKSDEILGDLEPVVRQLGKDTDGIIAVFGDKIESLGSQCVSLL